MKHTRLKSFILGTAMMVAGAGMAAAQTTAPGTTITNTIDLSYSSGAGTPTIELDDAATVAFVADRKIDLLVTASTGAGNKTAVQGQTEVVIPFRVQNLGNDTQGFDIDAEIVAGGTLGLTYSASATTTLGQYYLVISSDETLDAADPVYNTAAPANAGDLAPNGEYFVLVVANVPTTSVDSQEDIFVITATATQPGTATAVTESRSADLMVVSTVFADNASNAAYQPNEIDPSLTGQDKDNTRLVVTAPKLSATKTLLVLDENLPTSTFACATTPSGTPAANLAAIPGACLEYTIAVTNAADASTAATDIVITDPLPSNVTFVRADNIVFTGTNAGSATTTTQPANASGTVTATIGSLPAGTTATFKIRVTVE